MSYRPSHGDMSLVASSNALARRDTGSFQSSDGAMAFELSRDPSFLILGISTMVRDHPKTTERDEKLAREMFSYADQWAPLQVGRSSGQRSQVCDLSQIRDLRTKFSQCASELAQSLRSTGHEGLEKMAGLIENLTKSNADTSTLVDSIKEAILLAWASGTELERATNALNEEKGKEAEIEQLREELNAARGETLDLERKTTRLQNDLTDAQNRIDGLTQGVRTYEQISADGVTPQWAVNVPNPADNTVGYNGGYGHGNGTYGGDQGRLTGIESVDDMYRGLTRERSESPTQRALEWDSRSDDSDNYSIVS